MDAAALGYLVGSLESEASNAIKTLQTELRALRAEMAQSNRADSHFTTAQYDWQNPEFQGACDAIRDDFYARHPERVRGDGSFAREFPEKVKGVETLDRMSELNRIHPDEYLLLYKEIYNF